MIKKKSTKIVSRIITAGVVIIFAVYFFSNTEDFKILLDVNPVLLLLLALTNIISVVMNGVFMKWSVALFGKSIDFHESVRVSLISSAGNFFAPAGSGLGIRAVYLKKKHNLSYGDYISIIFCNYILVFFVSSLLGLGSLYGLYDQVSTPVLVLALFFGIMLILSSAAFFIRVRSTKEHPRDRKRLLVRIIDILQRVSHGWILMMGHKKIMFGLVLLVLASALLMIINTVLIMSSLGINLPFASIVLFSVLGSMSVFINITPGNLGVKEAVYIIFSSVIGLSTTEILAASLVDRGVLFGVLLLLWIAYGRKVYSAMTSDA